MRKLVIGVAIAVAGTLYFCGPVAAQQDDEASVRAAVDQIFEGMRTADAARVRSVFADVARFALLDERGATPVLRAQSVDGWLESVGNSGGRWNEQIYDVEIRVDGTLASVWAPYTFYFNGAIRHCGVNSIELLRVAGDWKVTQLSDSRRTGRCPDPLG
jgi:SnoaL-like domain